MFHLPLHEMFSLPVPLLEKIVRPIVVYLSLILLLRVFGKRELAQLNPFDLVVLLSLSNTVQNAIIGDDNSLSGGIVGAVTLLSINWLVVRILYSAPRINQLLTGIERTLILDGMLDRAALKKELLTEEELLAVVHRQGFDTFNEIAKCEIEPNGAFYIEGRKPSSEDSRQGELLARLDTLSAEVRAIRTRLDAMEKQS